MSSLKKEMTSYNNIAITNNFFCIITITGSISFSSVLSNLN